MPHSGGGGSHGGGGHGGSHGGSRSSHRTSHHYFHGARRYRRRYRNGREEYFYSNAVPRKASVGSLIGILAFGGIFMSIMGLGISSERPRRLAEEYDWPDTRVVDNIDVISDSDEDALEDVLEEYNDVTGICPVIYTMYVEDYEGSYVDLESFAYNKYVDEWEDEQHYLIVYAIPEDEAEDFRSGALEVPDYEWEIMQGDDTDKLFTENVDNSIISQVQNRFELGKRPGPVFKALFEELTENAEKAFKRKLPASAIAPFVFVGAFFLIPIIGIISSLIKERGMEYEEVPLTEEDTKMFSSNPKASFAASFADPAMHAQAEQTGAVITIAVLAFMGAFGLIPLIVGISSLVSGQVMGVAFLGFGILWIGSLVMVGISTMKGLKRMKNNQNPLTADYPKAEYPKAEYPKADYPEQTPMPVQSNPIWQTGTSYHPEDDEDDLRRKGYE